MNLYRIVQESLNNSLKYARAASISIRSKHANDQLLLRVEDDGVGFSTTVTERGTKPGGHGLQNIRERVQILGGRVNIDSKPGKGTRITVHIPLKPKATDAT